MPISYIKYFVIMTYYRNYCQFVREKKLQNFKNLKNMICTSKNNALQMCKISLFSYLFFRVFAFTKGIPPNKGFYNQNKFLISIIMIIGETNFTKIHFQNYNKGIILCFCHPTNIWKLTFVVYSIVNTI